MFRKCDDQIIAQGPRTLAIVLQATGLPTAPATYHLLAYGLEARRGYSSMHAG